MVLIKRIYKKYMEIKYRHRLENAGNVFDETVKLGKNCVIKNTCFGMYSGVNQNCIIENTKIGNYVNIAWGVTIGPRNHIYTNFTNHDFIYTKNEHLIENKYNEYNNVIGHDVWIGCNSIILPGVVIGNGSIIAAGSVITKSIPPYSIVGGNPGRFIKMRFTKKQILRLEESGWFLKKVDEVLLMKNYLEKLVSFSFEDFIENNFKYKKEYGTF